MFYETKRYSTAGLGRVIAVAVPSGCLQPVGLSPGLGGTGSGMLLSCFEKADI